MSWIYCAGDSIFGYREKFLRRADLPGSLVFPSESGVDKAERAQWRTVIWLLGYLLFGCHTSRGERHSCRRLVAADARG